MSTSARTSTRCARTARTSSRSSAASARTTGISSAPPRETEEAMRAAAEVIYQGVLVSPDGWRGLADFLERVDVPSALGDWSYQVADTKLARRPKPAHLLQLCFYSAEVARLQGVEPA